MKKGMKLFAAGAAIAAVAGAIVYRKYQESYEQIADEDATVVQADAEDDFVEIVETDDDFDYVVEEME